MSSSSSPNDTAVTEALSTDVILLYIFQHLGLKDLLDCRLVNQKWHAIASEALYPRHVYISNRKLMQTEEGAADYDDDGSDLDPKIADATDEEYAKNSKLLSDRICKNPHFRFAGLVIDRLIERGGGKIFHEFAKTCGKHVRRLRIRDVSENSPTKVPQLLDWFSEIEHLSVGDISNSALGFRAEEDNKSRRLNNDENIYLPKLTSLALDCTLLWDCGTRVLCEELIKSSPKLRRIKNFDIALTEVALRCGRLNAVTELNLHYGKYGLPSWGRKLSCLKSFSENSPPLRSFSCTGLHGWAQRQWSENNHADEEEWRLMKEVVDLNLGSVNRILISSKDTLKRLQIDYLDTLPVVLPHLKNLLLVDRREDDDEAEPPHRIFPREWPHAPRTYFPALQTVRLQLQNCQGDSVKAYLGELEDDTFPTVTVLEIACPFDEVGVQALGAAFPNVKTLRVFWEECGQSYLNDLWVFLPTLKILEIFDLGVEEEEFEDFDAAITGFPLEVCQNLRKRRRIPYDPCYLDAFRTGPSILNLKDLERLAIHFVCTAPEEVIVPESAVSPIAHWYGFDVMPNLKTQFLYNFKHKNADALAAALELYKPYVSVMPR